MSEFLEQVTSAGSEKVPPGESISVWTPHLCRLNPDPPFDLKTRLWVSPALPLPDPSATLNYLQIPEYVTISCSMPLQKLFSLQQKKKKIQTLSSWETPMHPSKPISVISSVKSSRFYQWTLLAPLTRVDCPLFFVYQCT